MQLLGIGARTVTRDSDRLAESFRRIGPYGAAILGLSFAKILARDLLQAGVAAQKLQTTFTFVTGTCSPRTRGGTIGKRGRAAHVLLHAHAMRLPDEIGGGFR